jgi:hypothetical protein
VFNASVPGGSVLIAMLPPRPPCEAIMARYWTSGDLLTASRRGGLLCPSRARYDDTHTTTKRRMCAQMTLLVLFACHARPRFVCAA